MDHTHCKEFGYRAHYNLAGQWLKDERIFAKPEEVRRYAQGIVDRTDGAILQFEVRTVCLETEHERI